jgi:zinc transport system substrate-binding protein
LHRLDVIAGKLDGSLRVTEPYSMDGHWNDPRPRLAVAGDKIAVTDPARGVVSLVDAMSLTKAGEISLGGRPFNIVAVGGSGQAHDD